MPRDLKGFSLLTWRSLSNLDAFGTRPNLSLSQSLYSITKTFQGFPIFGRIILASTYG